jgi:hypothetical protein
MIRACQKSKQSCFLVVLNPKPSCFGIETGRTNRQRQTRAWGEQPTAGGMSPRRSHGERGSRGDDLRERRERARERGGGDRAGAGTSHSRGHGAWCHQSSGFVEAWDQEHISSQPLTQRPLSLSPFLHAEPNEPRTSRCCNLPPPLRRLRRHAKPQTVYPRRHPSPLSLAGCSSCDGARLTAQRVCAPSQAEAAGTARDGASVRRHAPCRSSSSRRSRHQSRWCRRLR